MLERCPHFALLPSTPPSPKTETSPPFFAWKTQTQNVTTFHPFHQATALGSTMHCQSLPSLRLTHAAVKCREYMKKKKKGFLKLYTKQTCGKMLAKAQQWTWGRQMGYPLTWKANYGLNTKWGQHELWWFATQDWIVILSLQNGGVKVPASS